MQKGDSLTDVLRASYQSLVVIRWTRQLPLRLPFAITGPQVGGRGGLGGSLEPHGPFGLQRIIGASVSKPHTSLSWIGIFYY